MSPQEKTLRNALGRNVRRHREAEAMTVEDAAERADLHSRTWQRIEAGETGVTLETVGAMAAALDIDPLLLFRPPRG